MPDQITVASVQEYKASVDLLLQQKGSRFRKAVNTGSYRGKAASVVEQFGPVVAQQRTSRHSDTPLLDVPQAKRWVFPSDWEWASLVDKQDTLRMVVDPVGPYAQNGANAMARAQDDVIIAAFFATAYTGENGTTTEAFSTASFQVGVNTGGTASSLNVAKLQAANRMLMGAYYGEVDEPVYCGISSYEHDAMLKEIQVQSKDFNGGQPVLVDGRVTRFMGANFILSERLAISSGNRLIPFWTASGMHMGIWQDTETSIDKRPDKGNALQVYLCETIGATRLQQGKVIQILCDDLI